MNYHNSQSLPTGPELQTKSAKAGTQDARVLDWFKKYGGRHTPGDVFISSGIFDTNYPTRINSARRAISNLTKSGELTKTNQRKQCPVTGENVFSWELAEQQTKLF